jgi:hypothetical protein
MSNTTTARLTSEQRILAKARRRELEASGSTSSASAAAGWSRAIERINAQAPAAARLAGEAP